MRQQVLANENFNFSILWWTLNPMCTLFNPDMRLFKMILFYHQDDLDFVKHLINVCLLNPFMTEAVII